jgi:hypothetical protein
MQRLFSIAVSVLISMGAECATIDHRGIQFISFTNLSAFEKSLDSSGCTDVLVSQAINPGIKWDELIVSWNASMTSNSWLKVEARAFHGDAVTKFFNLGEWSSDRALTPRRSALNEKDEEGHVSTDTLILKSAADRVQLRITISGEQRPEIKFLTLCLTDTGSKPDALEPNRDAWGKLIPVPERSQMAYPNGKVLCSPTTVSMVMTYWSKKLNRPELDHDVPDVEKEVYDENWHGTGNWVFNTAYAGSYPGMRACVTRMSDVSELEDWIAQGLPVAVSLCYDRLRGKGPGPNGHLVVCVGFTKEGDVIINDPGTSKNIRKTFPRKNLIYAWANSKNAVYLIYPENAALPKDRFGHWSNAQE